jgi:hypothetical protein
LGTGDTTGSTVFLLHPATVSMASAIARDMLNAAFIGALDPAN